MSIASRPVVFLGFNVLILLFMSLYFYLLFHVDIKKYSGFLKVKSFISVDVINLLFEIMVLYQWRI